MQQVAPGVQEMNDLQAAGFNSQEIEDWRATTTRDLQDAGFTHEEVTGYFGEVEPDTTNMKKMWAENTAKNTPEEGKPAQPQGVPVNPEMQQAQGFIDAIEAGLDMSVGLPGVTGLLNARPDMVLPEHAPRYMRIASQVGQLVGDIPAMLGGLAAGTAIGTAAGTAVPVVGNVAGGIIGGGAGSFALPEGIRTVMMEHYEKGDIKSFGDFWERVSAVAINSGKAAIIGGATAGMGGKVAQVLGPVVAPTAVKTAARLSSEVATMTTLGAALEGHAPEPQDFIDAAILVGGMHAVMHVSPKLRRTYAKTGVKPEELAQKAAEDPKFKQQLLSENNQVVMGGEMGTKEAPPEHIPVTKPLREPNPELSPEVNTILGKVQEKTDPTIKDKVVAAVTRAKEEATPDKLYTAFVDKLDPINQATKILTETKGELVAENNPYILARQAVDAKAKAKHFFEKGTLDYNTKEIRGESLRNTLQNVESLEVLEAYMVSKRAIEKEAQGFKSGFDMDAARKVVEQNKGKYEAAAQKVTKFSNDVLDYATDAGVLSKEQNARFREANKDYVPFKRIMEDGEAGGKGNKPGSLKNFKGSDKGIQSPISSILENTIQLIQMAENNRPAKALVDLAAKTEGQKLISKVPERMQPIKISKEELAAELKRQGIIEGSEQAKAVEDMMVFRKAQTDLTPTQFQVMENGKRVVYETTPEVAETLQKLGGDVTSANVAFRLMNAVTQFKKLTITFVPDFIVKNMMRDWVTGSTFTKGTGGIAPWEALTAMKDIWTKNDHYYEWLKSGGANGAFLEMNQRYMEKDIYKLQKETNFLNSAANIVMKPIDAMRVAAELSEQSLRVAEFKKVRAKGGSLVEAGQASREITVDFQRVGARIASLNAITAFMNVSIQGLDRTARAFKENPTGTTLKAMAYITAPSVLLWWANKDDQRMKEIPQWQKDHFWIIPTDKWVQVTPEEADGLPDYMVKTEGDKVMVNKGTIYRIPKPQELGLVFGSLPERVLEKYFGENPQAMKEFDKSVVGLIMPNLVPDAAAPMVEQFFNRNFFTGRDIIPHHLQQIQREYQFTEYTSETAKFMGKMVATLDKDTDFASPMVLQNYIQSWGGALGRYAIQAMDKALVKAGVAPDIPKPADTLADNNFVRAFVVRFPQANSNSVQEFYDNYDKTEVTTNTIRHLAKQGDFDNMEKEMTLDANQEYLVQLDGFKEGMSNQAQLIRMITKDPDMSPDEKRQMIDGLYFNMTEIAKAGNEMMKSIKEQLGEK